MSVLSRAELLLQAKNYSGSGAWLDESGNGHDAQLGSVAGADTNDPLFKPWDGVSYAYMPGTAGNYVSSADVNLLDADTAHVHQSAGRWTVSTFTTISTTSTLLVSPASFGTKVLQGTITAAPDWYANIRTADLVTPVTALTQYTFAFDLTPELANRKARVEIDWRTAGGLGITVVEGGYFATPVGSWTRVSLTVTSPATAAFAVLQMTVVASDEATALTEGERWQTSAMSLRTGTSAVFVPSLRIVGNLDIRARVSLAVAPPVATGTLLSTRDTGAGTSGFSLQVNATTGNVAMTHGTGADARAESSTLFALAANTVTEIRGTYDVSAGTNVYYKDGVQVDTDTFTPGAAAGSGLGLFVGAATNGADRHVGDIYYAEVRDGIDGPVVARYSGADAVEPFATQTDAVTGRTWTYNRSASGLVTTVVDRDMFLLTTDDRFQVTDNAALDFGAADDFTLLVVTRQNFLDSTMLLAKRNLVGYFLQGNAGINWNAWLDEGASINDVVAGGAIRTLSAVGMRRDQTANELEAFLNGVGSGSPTTTTNVDLTSGTGLFIGSAGTHTYYEGQIIAVALWREALTEAEIAAVGAELTGSGVPQMMLMGVG